MKKQLITFALFLPLLLTGCHQEGLEPKRATTGDSSYQTVCKEGDLGTPKREVNLLPPSFWGNDPQVGRIEVGGKAGDSYRTQLPNLSFTLEQPTNLLIGICFNEDPTTFEENTENLALGYTFSIKASDGQVKTKEVYSRVLRLKDRFTESNNGYAYGVRDGNKFSTFDSIYHEANALLISFVLNPGDEIISFSYLYGDQPKKIENVTLTLMAEPMLDILQKKYNGPDCSASLYTDNVGASPEYFLHSQYGSVYSKDYLSSCFLAKDRDDSSEFHPTDFVDPNNYFTTGASAVLGSVFTVYLNAYDSSGNKSTITFHITITDEKGPTILFPEGREITASYQEDCTSEAFLDNHVLIKDNYSSQVDVTVTDVQNNPIPKKRLGTYSCLINAEDERGNITQENFSLTYIDDVPPVITSDADEVNLTPYNAMSKEEIKSLFHATDEIDGTLSLEVIEDTYTPNADKIGEYSVTVKATDRSENTSTKKIVLRVQDSEGPVFYVKKSFIKATAGNIPTTEEIISSLIRQEVIPDKRYLRWDVIEGEKITNSLPVGIHEFTLLLEAEDESSETVHVTLEILPKESSETKTLSFFDKILLFFKKLWEKIVSFFTGK